MTAPITTLSIMHADGRQEELNVALPCEPDIFELKDLLTPLLGGDPEHILVFDQAVPSDMFVDDNMRGKGLPRNERATEIYRALFMRRHPERDPESLPAIYGTAVLFSRKVWPCPSCVVPCSIKRAISENHHIRPIRV